MFIFTQTHQRTKSFPNQNPSVLLPGIPLPEALLREGPALQTSFSFLWGYFSASFIFLAGIVSVFSEIISLTGSSSMAFPFSFVTNLELDIAKINAKPANKIRISTPMITYSIFLFLLYSLPSPSFAGLVKYSP